MTHLVPTVRSRLLQPASLHNVPLHVYDPRSVVNKQSRTVSTDRACQEQLMVQLMARHTYSPFRIG